MLNSTQFQTADCPKIDALDVAASFELSLDEVNPAMLHLDTSWGCTSVDLTPAVQASETITHLFLAPSVNPTSLQYNREDFGRENAEDNGIDCITGDELSRIISMRLLKDVSQLSQIADGMVYMWNGINSLFEPYDLQSFVNETNTTLEQHTSSITQLQGDVTAIKNSLELLTRRVTALETRMTTAETNIQNLQQRMTTAETNIQNNSNRISAIENAIYNWGSDKTTAIARGTINLYGGPGASVSKNKGIYTHNPNNNVVGDLYGG